MTNQNPNPDEQSWDVFRYVAGEMSSGEETHFEQLLENDQALREEVAGMVNMMATVNDAHRPVKVSLPNRNHTSNRRVQRILVSAAALALLATLAVALLPKAQLSDSSAESVAIAWAEAIETDEFELPEQNEDFEFASLEFDSDDDWIVDAIAAGNEESSIN